ncbi:hypothetical protein DFH08DRAFT_816773 [Mycena albidolilacea]|uniref:Uncharacterized protein n=1 Tax=Mycena albidolilacea TaxID=1033008 RepID=A0AAD7EI02_9AGAR|nr:hypothetical protein DFH08DRAFT_816773 [Mycena albidolilacea]
MYASIALPNILIAGNHFNFCSNHHEKRPLSPTSWPKNPAVKKSKPRSGLSGGSVSEVEDHVDFSTTSRAFELPGWKARDLLPVESVQVLHSNTSGLDNIQESNIIDIFDEIPRRCRNKKQYQPCLTEREAPGHQSNHDVAPGVGGQGRLLASRPSGVVDAGGAGGASAKAGGDRGEGAVKGRQGQKQSRPNNMARKQACMVGLSQYHTIGKDLAVLPQRGGAVARCSMAIDLPDGLGTVQRIHHSVNI